MGNKNPIDLATKRLLTKGWLKGCAKDTRERVCLLTALHEAHPNQGEWTSHDRWLIPVVADIIRENWPHRIDKDSSASSVIATFNDHPETNFRDIQTALHKSSMVQ